MRRAGANAMKLLVTGAGGFVGAAVVRAGLDAGHDVIATGRSSAPGRLRGVAAAYHAVDLSDAAALGALMDAERPDVIVHSAWEGVSGAARGSDVQFANIGRTCTLIDAAIAAGARKFVGIGSQAEYGRFDRRITEADLPTPTMLYGAAKLAALHLIRQRMEAAGRTFAWLRIFSTYGPNDNPNWLIPGALAEMRAGRAPKLTAGTQKWDYLHVDDVARGILAAAVTPAATGVFNLSSGIGTPVRTVIETLRDHAAPGLELKFGEIPFGPTQIMHLEGDNSRLKAATGWTPQIDIRDGLKALAA